MNVDFLTNVETAFISVFCANALLKEYNWQRWDSDETVKLPRGVLGLRARREPEDTPYHRVEVMIRFEGRPKRHKLSAVMNELKDVLEATNTTDLDAASGNTVQFIGRAISVGEERPVNDGLRMWLFGFVIYAVPMV